MQKNRSVLAALVLTSFACGARSELEIAENAGGAPVGGAPVGGTGGEGGEAPPCLDGEIHPCGSNEGECQFGVETCVDGAFGPCLGGVTPVAEVCNNLDENCDGAIDEPFGVGLPCDGPDSDECEDDIMSCAGCSLGDPNVELCNGIDDNCNGIIDADCEIGDCQPTLVVTGSTPSSPGCVDFPVVAGSEGVIQFPCGGGVVTASLGAVDFTGSVVNGQVSLDGTAIVIGPDECTWQTFHHISGNLYAGELTYSYAEEVISVDIGQCWSPCTEVGEVEIEWLEPED
jgi:hypothetical protein